MADETDQGNNRTRRRTAAKENHRIKKFVEDVAKKISIIVVFSTATVLVLNAAGLSTQNSYFWALVTATTVGLTYIIVTIARKKRDLIRIALLSLVLLCLSLIGFIIWIEFLRIPKLLEDANRDDPLMPWSQEIRNEVSSCEIEVKTNNEGKEVSRSVKDPDCLVKAIKNHPMPGISTTNQHANLAHDIRAGQLLIADEVISGTFKRQLGIGSSFLGTGTTLPQGENVVYNDARLSEYLIPNKRDDNPDVLTWIFDPKAAEYTDRTIECLVAGCDAKSIGLTELLRKNGNSEAYYKEQLSRIARDWSDERIFIRFQQFPVEEYKGTLAPDWRQMAFMCRLKDVWKMRLRDAAIASGHTVNHKNNAIFMWIYSSTQSDHYAPTWRNIINHPDWLKKRSN